VPTPADRTARPAQDRDRIDRAIEHASWPSPMFAYGAGLSFDVPHSIALAAGYTPIQTWLWPLGLETFMAVAAVAVLAKQRTRPHKTPLGLSHFLSLRNRKVEGWNPCSAHHTTWPVDTAGSDRRRLCDCPVPLVRTRATPGGCGGWRPTGRVSGVRSAVRWRDGSRDP
jgi:hypothetical protein